MGTNPTKAADNIYCKCRKEAAKYNDKLNSREGAAELLGISASTLADYELGITKIIPADAILRMADLYNAPELRNHYCKYSCPLGQDVPLVDTESLDRIAVRALASLKKVQESKENLLDEIEGEKGQHSFLILETENNETGAAFQDQKQPEVEIKDLASILQKDELLPRSTPMKSSVKTDVLTMMENGETFPWHIPEQSPRTSYRRI